MATNTDYNSWPARYSKGNIVAKGTSTTGFKSRADRLLEACGGRYVNRSGGYTLSPSAFARFEKLYAAGWDGGYMRAEITPPVNHPLALALAGKVIYNIGQLDHDMKLHLERAVRDGKLVKWRGYWYPISGGSSGMGPLKTCYGTQTAKDCAL